MSASSGDEPSLRTPPLVYSALVFSLLRFACALPAVVGLVAGIFGRRQAQRAGVGVGLATTAIAISAAWLLLFGLLAVIAQVTNSGS